MTPPDAEPPQPPVADEPFPPDALEMVDDSGAGECPYDRETKILQAIEWEDEQDEQRQS